MRVTKIIKDYVNETIGKKYDAKAAEIMKPYYDEEEALEAEINKIANEANLKIKEILKGTGFAPRFSEDVITIRDIVNKKKYDELFSKKSKILKEGQNKIKDVLIDLELGSVSRKELDEILSNI